MMGLALGIVILFLAFCLGRALLQLLRLPAEADEQLVLGTALGLGVLAYAVLILGLLGRLTSFYLWGLVVVTAIWALLSLRGAGSTLKAAFGFWKLPLSKTDLAVFAFSGVAVGAILLGLLAPETANDSLCYHLHLPKIFLMEGRIYPVPYEVNALFPFLMEMLYTLGLGLEGMTLAKFFHFATGLLAAGGILTFARRAVPISSAWWCALLFLTAPGIANELGTTYVDVGLTCYTTLALTAFLRWVETKKMAWIVIAGIFAGFMLSVKYLAMISMLGIAALFMGEIFARKQDFSVFVKAAVAYSTLAFVCGSYWYLDSWIETGNPVFPYFQSIFGSGDPTIHYEDIGVPKNPFAFFAVPWILTMHPQRFEGFGVQLGPGYLAFLPAVFLRWRSFPWVGSLTVFSLIYFASWFLLGQSLRFLFPLLGVLGLLIAVGFGAMEKGFLERCARFFVAMTFLIHGGLAVYHYRDEYRVALGLESREEYLSREERSYEVARFVNGQLPPKAKILAADETHLFYFRRPIVREVSYAARSAYHAKAHSAAEVMARLKKDGFTHLLVVQAAARGRSGMEEPLRVGRLIAEKDNALAESVDLIYTEKATAPNGDEFDYNLYALSHDTR